MNKRRFQDGNKVIELNIKNYTLGIRVLFKYDKWERKLYKKNESRNKREILSRIRNRVLRRNKIRVVKGYKLREWTVLPHY